MVRGMGRQAGGRYHNMHAINCSVLRSQGGQDRRTLFNIYGNTIAASVASMAFMHAALTSSLFPRFFGLHFELADEMKILGFLKGRSLDNRLFQRSRSINEETTTYSFSLPNLWQFSNISLPPPALFQKWRAASCSSLVMACIPYVFYHC